MLHPYKEKLLRRAGLAALLLAGLAVLIGIPMSAHAQITSGTIFGSVQDSTGAMLPSATITATEPSIGISRTAVTSSNGTFSLPNLAPGTYTLEASAPGFRNLRKTGIILSAADNLSAGVFQLSVGAASATVEVAADAGQLQVQSDSGERSDLITSKQLDEVAMNGRNVLDYLRLIPGVAGVGQFASSGTGGLSSFNINGTRSNSHEFTLDGSSNVDTGDNGGTHVTINTDAIAEVKFLTSNYAAEFGKASGGQIAVVSKGGSNEFHGGAHFFHRNEGMNATGWYNNHNKIAKMLYRYNTEGYDLGGPIKHNKLFFFWSNEFYQQLVPQGTNTYYVPTAAERAGNFSKSYNSAGVPLTIYQPGTTTAYSSNTLPSSAINSSMQTVMNLYALPNVSSFGTSQFSYNRIDNVSYSQPRQEYIARMDYQISPGERAFVRWTSNRASTTTPMQTGVLQCMGTLQIVGGCKNTAPGWNLAVDLTSTLTAHLLNEVSFGPSVSRTTWTGNNGNLSVGKNNISLPLLYSVSSDTSIPDISYGGNGQSYPWSYFGANPWFQANTTINANDNLSWSHNNHNFKFGVFYQRSRKDQPAWGNFNGQFNFNNCATSNNPSSCDPATGSPFASALVGDFANFDQSSSRPRGYFRYNQLEFYAQDTWQIIPRLTLNYGMRFAWIPPQYDAKNQIALFDPSSYVKSAAIRIDTSGNPVAGSGNALAGMKYASDGSLPKGGWKDNGILPEVRLGFAWDFVGDHKGVVRGGFGMSHDREQGNLVFNPTFTNPKNNTTPSISAQTYLPLSAIKTATQNASGVLSGIIGADRNGQVPTVYSFSLGVQRELGAGFSADVAYVGTLSRHLVTARDINEMPYGTTFTKAAQNPANFAGGVVPNVEPNLPPEYAAAGYSFTGQYAYPSNYLAPYWGYDQIEYYKFDGTSNYNSLQMSLQRRFSKGLTAGAVYTWSKSMTTSSNDESYVDPFNPRQVNYQVAAWDRTHVAAVNYVYDIPAISKHLGGSRVMSYLTDGFQLSGVSNFMTGTPTWTSFWVDGAALLGGRNWTKVPPAYLGIDGKGKPILPTIGKPYKGTPARLRDGGMQTWDMSLFKNYPLGKATRTLQIRLEAYNAFNHSNFASHDLGAGLTLPSYNGSSYTAESVSLDSGWKQPTSMWSQAGPGGPRVLQLGAKINF